MSKKSSICEGDWLPSRMLPLYIGSRRFPKGSCAESSKAVFRSGACGKWLDLDREGSSWYHFMCLLYLELHIKDLEPGLVWRIHQPPFSLYSESRYSILKPILDSGFRNPDFLSKLFCGMDQRVGVVHEGPAEGVLLRGAVGGAVLSDLHLESVL